jgi:Cytochrome P460
VARMKGFVTLTAMAYVVAFSLAVGAQQAAGDGPRYSNGTTLIRPTNYREWVFLGAGLGMTYDPSRSSQAAPRFGNVFVNPSSYRSFMQTGRWPNGTIFVLENRNSGSEASINKAGRFQTSLAGIEAEVKDARFPDGWAFFNFGPAQSLKETSEPLSGEEAAPCVECHTKNTAVERTFVQFYPTLLEVARQKGTLKPGY